MRSRKHHRAEAGDDADDQGQQREIDQPDPADVVVGRRAGVRL